MGGGGVVTERAVDFIATIKNITRLSQTPWLTHFSCVLVGHH